MNPFRYRRFTLAATFVAALVLIILGGRILFAQDPEANALISNAASVLCALIAAVFFGGVWVSTASTDISKRIWGQVALSLALWTIAEAIWGFYEVILKQPVPYPSIADFFWIIGYVPLYLALITQYRLYQIKPDRYQKLTVVLIVLVFSLIGSVVVLKPIVEGFDPERILESLLNIAYPTLDLVLLILTFVIIFSLAQGRFASTWRVLGAGLVIMSVADLLFSYSSWNEIYNPDGQLNSITLLTDGLFYLSYLILGLAAYTYRLTSEALPEVNINIDLQALTKSNILVFIDRQGKIISLSDNFLNLVGAQDKDRYVNMPLSEALGIENLIVEALVTETLERGSLSTQPLRAYDVNREPKEIWLTSIAAYDEHGQFVCIAAVLRTNFADQAGPERPLTGEQKQLINLYLTEAGTYRSEENQVIKTYFLQQVNLLYSLVQQFSGTAVAERLLSHLNQVASQNGWQFSFTAQKITIPQEYEGQTLAARLSTLLQEAKLFAVNMTNLRVVEHEMRILDNNLGAESLRHVDKYDLRKFPKPAFQGG